jgi:hypothetical protein
LIDDGTSVLFVSHDISTVRSICSRALWLKNGHAEMWGDAKDVATQYERFCWQEQGVVLQNSGLAKHKMPESLLQLNAADVSSSVPSLLFSPNATFETNRRRSRAGTGDVVIKNFLMLNEDGHPATSCDFNEKLTLYYLLDVCRPVNSEFVIGVWFRDLKGNSVYSANDLTKIHKLRAAAGESFVVSAKLRIPLSHQDYEVHTSIFGFKEGKAHSGESYDFTRAVVWDMTDSAAYLTVRPNKVMPIAGPVGASFDLQIAKI